jgi:dTDP-4-amino-4,6-dideoxygalactose transaminase
VESFERQLASYLKTRYAVCVSSGTAALHLGLLALGIGRGDEVIVPAFSYPASANAVELTKARVTFVDSLPDCFNIDTGQIENSITARTRVIMVVHNFGWPVDMTRVRSLSAKYDIPIFEDAACALGSSLRGERCGNLGRLAAFSFHPRKILTTGEGGAVVTDDPAIAQTVRELRNHGQRYGNGVNFVAPGFNYRMTEFQAALGISQMKRFKTVLRARRRAAEYYNHAIADIDFLKLPAPNGGGKPNYQTYTVSVENDWRDALISHLKNNGIEAGIGTYSVPHTAYYSENYNVDESQYPNSWRFHRNLISLPLFENISAREQEHVISALKTFAPEKKQISVVEQMV